MSRKPDLTTPACMMIVAAFWFAFCWPWFVDGNIIPHDAKNHFYAMVRFLAASFHGGESPLWSPYHYGGFPMVADPQSIIWTPSLWLPAFLSSEPSMPLVDAVQLTHLLVIGFVIFAFARARGWGITASLVTAITAMLGGALTVRLEHVLMTISMMWLSIALWRLDATLRWGGLWRSFLFGFSLAMLLIDRDHVAYLGAWFLLLYWLHEVYAKRSHFSLKTQLPVVAGGTIALILAAIPLLLLLQLADNSNRPNFDLLAASWQSLHPAALATLALPEFFGPLHDGRDYWGPAGATWGGEKLMMHRGMLHFYGGVLPLLLILWHGIFRRRLWTPDSQFFLLFALVMMLYALGRYTPFFGLLFDWVPGVQLFRRPADGLFLFGLSMALLSGALLDDLLQGNGKKPNKRSEITLLIAVFTPLYFLALMAVERARFDALLMSLLMFVLLTGSMGGLLFLAHRFPKLRTLFLSGFVLIVGLDLIHHQSNIRENTRPDAFYLPQANPFQEPVFATLKSLLREKDPSGVPWRAETLGFGPSVQNIAMVGRFHNLLGYNPIRLKIFADHIGPNMQNNAASKRRFGDKMTSYDSPTTNQLGLRYIVTGAPLQTIDPQVPDERFTLVVKTKYQERDAYIYENPEALPRAVFIPKGGAYPVPVKVTTYQNDKVEIEVDAKIAGRLVLHDFVYPGWEAWVDEKRTPIETHDQLFRSIRLAKGLHKVSFRFRPLTVENIAKIAATFFQAPKE